MEIRLEVTVEVDPEAVLEYMRDIDETGTPESFVRYELLNAGLVQFEDRMCEYGSKTDPAKQGVKILTSNIRG